MTDGPPARLPEPGPGHLSLDALAARETALEIEAALAELPVEQRCAIMLVDVHGMPVDDVAAVLGVPSGTVKSRCSRGRARLAVTLGALRNPDGSGPVTPGTTHRTPRPEGGT